MFPVIFSYGPFELRTMSIFMVLAFLVSAYVFWKKGKEEHYGEGEFFDGFLMAAVIGFIGGRLGFIALNFDRFGFSILKWLDIFTFPGINGLIGLVIATLYLRRFARNNKWDIFEVLDFWVLALVSGMIWSYIGLFFDGSAFGNPTHLPVGVMFPGVQETHHPVQLYSAAFFILLGFYLSKVELRYRTFAWYRAGKKTAQTGFLVCMFLLAISIFYFVLSWFKPPTFQTYGIDIDRILALLAFISGLFLLYTRSGRSFHRKRPIFHQVTETSNE